MQPRINLDQPTQIILKQISGPDSTETIFLGQRLTLCPHLGAKDDPQLARSYVTTENHCHHVIPVTKIRAEQQRVYCLTDCYQNCPIYRRNEKLRVKPKPAKTNSLKAYLLPTLLVCMMFVLAAAVIVAAMGW